MIPSDLDLPYSGWTPGQWESILEIALCDSKYILVEAPTGSGKSAVATAVSRLVKHGNLQVLTGTKQLQDQYSEGLGLFKVMGRNNFPCDIAPSVTADKADCVSGWDCDLRKSVDGNPPDCAYYRQKWYGMKRPEVVFNYAYWLAMQNYAGWRKAGLLVCDEAHTLEDEVRRFKSLSLNDRHLGLLRLPVRPESDVEGWCKWATEVKPAVAELHANLEKGTTPEDKRWHAAVTGVWRVVSELADPETDPDEWVCQDRMWGVEFNPVWVDRYAYDLVFGHAERVLMMSATVLDPGMFCEQLGIPRDQCAFIRVPSTFPKERRPFYIMNGVRVRGRDDASLRAVTTEIDGILAKYPGERGLVHTGSYKIADYVAAHSKFRGRILSHNTRSRVSVLDRFRRTPGAVLVSPSVSTGVDLPYDLCRFQVIAKIPFPDQGDPQVKRRMKELRPGVPSPKGQSWYNWTALCNLVQAYGRGMRAVDDQCDTYLVDGNWSWFRHTVKEMIPTWVSEAFRYEKDIDTTRGFLAQLGVD